MEQGDALLEEALELGRRIFNDDHPVVAERGTLLDEDRATLVPEPRRSTLPLEQLEEFAVRLEQTALIEGPALEAAKAWNQDRIEVAIVQLACVRCTRSLVSCQRSSPA